MNVPSGFEGAVDGERLRRIQEYTLEKSRFGGIASVCNNLVTLAFIFCGILAWYDGWIRALGMPPVATTVVFFLLLGAASFVLDLPFGAFQAFKIEARHGFNTMTLATWVVDAVKSLLLSSALTAILVGCAFWLVAASPRFWWLWVWIFIALFSVFLMYVAPYVIEPLFNKFEPLKDLRLDARLKELFSRIGIEVRQVRVMDASMRTRHGNAYFSGIGKVKRIVLYDNLLTSMDEGELVAVLAHEAGHWRKKHILKTLCLVELVILGGMYAAFRLVQGDALGVMLGMPQASLMAKLVILQFVAGIVMFPMTPLAHMLSRRFEREADDFAVALCGGSDALSRALIKLSADNLSNLHPHPLYAFFHYSHPPVQERVKRLRTAAHGA